MNPAFLDDMSWEMAEVYGAISDQILINLAHYFPYFNAHNLPASSFAYQAGMLAQMGKVNADTAKIIRNGLADADSALNGVLEAAIIQSIQAVEPDLYKAARLGILQAPMTPILSPNQTRAFQLYYQQSVDKLNFVNTVMLASTQQAYQNKVSDIANRVEYMQRALNVGAGEVVTGVSTWNQAMTHAINRLKQTGITGFIDHAGHRWSAEAYTAMDIRTTVFNTGRAAVWEVNQDFGNDLYLVSYHNGARPLCYPWQSKVISATDNARTVVDLDGNEITVYAQSDTSYGEPAGLFGINCKHYPTPFIPGVSTIHDHQQSPEANEKTYAESQEQRRLERTLREEKRDLAMLKAQNAPEEVIKAQKARCERADERIEDFCLETGRARHRDREAVYTKRSFPDANTYDPKTFNRTQRELMENYWKERGAQMEYTFGEMKPNEPLIPKAAKTTPPVTKTPISPQATDKFVTEYLPNCGIAEVPVTRFEKQLTEREIISRVGGLDKTKGSCVSVSFAYTGNKAGLDVLDFRDGESRRVFSMNVNISKVARFNGVDGIIENTVNDYSGAHKVLKHVEDGKQYILRTGKHAAIVRKNGSGILQYLELQASERENVWETLDDSALGWRFGCQKSHVSYGTRYGLDNVLIDVEKLGKSEDFQAMLKYINTAADKQRKGVGGGIK